MATGLSEKSLEDWRAFVAALGPEGSLPVEHELLHQFVINVHRRREPVYAQELKALVDEAGLPAEAGPDLIATIEQSLGLLQAYDRAQAADEDLERDELFFGDEDDVAPGVVIF